MDDQDPELSPNEQRAIEELRRQDDAQRPWTSQYQALVFLIPILVALGFLVAWRTSPGFRLIVTLFVGGVIVVVVALVTLFLRADRDIDR